ncbi:hypothetical protein EVAR_64122_1 [Eumeta japonica]|uniref:Uncharacterized protein n=1 Tax=Eumeta variegata TaxID=151549 RepID=A0A4C1ZB73_EUMVA|nr:hypothetical protein EVAR_64122_1 [Eumeta japonica]
MEAALPHLHRLGSSRFYQHYAAPVRITTNYLHELVPQHHPTLLQHYLAYYSEPAAPLDLSLKPTVPITPPCTPSPNQKKVDSEKPPKIFRHFEEEKEESSNSQKRKADDRDVSDDGESPEAKKLKFTKQFFEELQTCLPKEPSTPTKSDRDSPEVVEVKDVDSRPIKVPP